MDPPPTHIMPITIQVRVQYHRQASIRTINHDLDTAKLKSSLTLHRKEAKRISKPQERHTDRPKHHFHENNGTFLRMYYPIPKVELLHVFQCSTLVVFDSSFSLTSPRILPYTPRSGLHKDSRPQSSWLGDVRGIGSGTVVCPPCASLQLSMQAVRGIPCVCVVWLAELVADSPSC